MHRILIVFTALSLAACSGSSGGSSGSSGSNGTSGSTAGTTGSTGSSAGTTGSSGASCTNTVTSPVSFTEGCDAAALDGAASNDGGATLTITGAGSSTNANETAGFYLRIKDQGWAAKTYTQADALEWTLLLNDDQGNTVGRGSVDTFGSFTLNITSASAGSFDQWELHGNLTSQFAEPFADGGSTTVNVTSQF